jgi:hypothetical protein
MANNDRLTGGAAPYGEDRRKLIEMLEAAIPMAKQIDPTVEFFMRLALERLRARQPQTSRGDQNEGC